MRALWGLRDLSKADLDHLVRGVLPPGCLVPKPAKVALLFEEPSTRTWASFSLAAQDIGAHLVTITAERSSLVKGESYEDTLRNLQWLGVRACVIRTKTDGLPERLAAAGLPVINAGDGRNEHPTQALADAAALHRHFGKIKGLRVLIAGDVSWSRVALSNMYALTALGAHVELAAPQRERAFIMEEAERLEVPLVDFDEGVRTADAIMMLRWQDERHMATDTEIAFYSLTEKLFSTTQEHCMVLHPGPVGPEVAPSIAQGTRSLISEQVRQGLQVRRRVLWQLLISSGTGVHPPAP